MARALLQERAADPIPLSLVFGWGGPRLLPAGEGLAALDRAEAMWGEHAGATGDTSAFESIAAWLETGREPSGPRRVSAPRAGRLGAALGALRRLGLRRGADPTAAAPQRALYLNATHFPLDWPSHVAWLDRRRDVRLAVLVHDLLPLDHPEFFWSAEGKRHADRLALLARRGAGAIVTSAAVEARLRDAMARAGRTDLAILRAAPPVAPVFHEPPRRDVRLSARPYFLVCGTIEPRKNHLLLLHVWRRLLAERGEGAPKLVVVGKRGWLCEAIVAELADPALAHHVIEASSLTSGDYKRLLDNARALLAPSLAEGFGLPVAEALTSGVPVVASDIPPFREQGGQAMTLIDATADTLWYDAIVGLCDGAAGETGRGTARAYRPVSEAGYVDAVRAFLATLP